MLKYKIDILQALKEAGYNSNKIRIENIMSQSTLQKFRKKSCDLSFKNLDTICTLLRCQPGDLLEWVPDDE